MKLTDMLTPIRTPVVIVVVLLAILLGTQTARATSPPPVIFRHPVSQVAVLGSDVRFRVGATAIGSQITYRWYSSNGDLVEGRRFSGVTTETLTIRSVGLSDTGDYTCLAQSLGGATLSAPGMLTVLPVGFAVQPQSRIVLQGSNVLFNVEVASTEPVSSYQWTKDGSNLIDNGRISGTLTPSLAIDGLELRDRGSYRCEINNPLGSAISDAAVLHVQVTDGPILQVTSEVGKLDPFTFSWLAPPGHFYDVRATTDFDVWDKLSLNPLRADVNGGQKSWLDPANQPHRFYQLVDLTLLEHLRLTNLVWIPPGTFTMGSPQSEAQRDSDEGPLTEVTISQGFWIGRREVTQAEYVAAMGNNPSLFDDDPNRPVEGVTWFQAREYCARLTGLERRAGRLSYRYLYRLPTEAEWEYACRAGSRTAFHYGPGLSSGMANFNGGVEYYSSVGDVNNPAGIYPGETTIAGSYVPNAWGLYDMHGNVSEWCLDWYTNSLPGGTVVDPVGITTDPLPYRVYRGGNWIVSNRGRDCRSANRLGSLPGAGGGIRVVVAGSMVWIPPGTFRMGSPESEQGRKSDEGPETVVTLSRGFWMGRHEVTQAEYEGVMDDNPSHWKNAVNLPVESVSWEDATNYCARLTEQERAAGWLPPGYVYRLPTEAEWEYACRAGTSTRFSYGDDPDYTHLNRYVWSYLNSEGRTHPVGEKIPNSWGLYDMHGNVSEWCSDWYAPAYPGGNVSDPPSPAEGSFRVLRGGSWFGNVGNCRSASRDARYPSYVNSVVGFRVVLAPVQ